MCNILIKYTNDTNLLVPEHTECSLTEGFTHICDWPKHNKMRINITKTKNSSGDEIANVNLFYKIAHVEASAYAH